MAQMARHVHSTIRYDGPALADHSMDVSELAPALLALSDLVKIANAFANGDRAAVRIKVNADLEQHCFELNLQLAMTIWEQAKLLLDDENVRSAKEVAEWVGIVGQLGGPLSLFALIRFLRGRQVRNTTVVRLADGRNMVEVEIEGEEQPAVIAQQVYELYANIEARKKAVEVMRPLRLEGYDTLEFREGGKEVFRITEDEVPAADLSDMPEVIPQNVNRSTILTSVRIRKAAYEGNAKWTVMYKRAIEAPVEDKAWLDQFQSAKVQAPPGSALEVTLEETYITNELGEVVGDPTYKILKVHRVIPRAVQTKLDFRDEG